MQGGEAGEFEAFVDGADVVGRTAEEDGVETVVGGKMGDEEGVVGGGGRRRFGGCRLVGGCKAV